MGAATMLAFAGLGSALGIGAAGQAAVGAWKKCYMNNKQVPFLLIAFVGAPASQTIYAMILNNIMIPAYAKDPHAWIFGVFASIGLGASAYFQGRIGAAAADAIVEGNNQGGPNYLIALGVIETIALFVMVFSIIALGALTK
jgi:V/A-type H+/Na+-transporting ATPase subunit K